ncbi:MAG TPA: divergent polysaccharide deacetylase family protein [Candidatus Aminicenantes bacterium]|nr:divergent polysaccharide deacetylase family protein [Candidatus Aminicenantes bacterium]HRY66146.1 divergent polysaccharide deacetylase family protein [Candidatus Aminicenantes bacterium]HRZ73060.1 divergent polysaccharide deacetylase family protein [Candidatus Aminicenantes bacterium]
MTNRRPSPGREPRPAFSLLTAILIGAALVATFGLDYLSSRRNGRSYIFRAAAEAPATPPAKPAEKIVPAPAPQPAAARPFDEVVAATLAAAGVSEDSTLRLKGPRGRPLFEVEIPAELYESLGPAVEKALAAQGIRVLDKKRTPGEDRTEILWALRRPAREEAAITFVLPVEPPPVAPAAGTRVAAAKRAPRGRVALIMDDMGNSLEVLDELTALGRPITVSVLPYGSDTAETARLAHDRGLEVLLHLPLESINNHEAMADTEGLIMAMMTEPAIVAAFEAGYDRVPFAAGTNNHMGSRFTADRDLMRTVLKPIRDRGLFFVDSRTTARTVALEEARRLGVPSTERDVFLDADEDRGRIRGRLVELLQKARKKGRAVGICHPFPETLAVLKSSLHLVDVYDLEMVPVSKLVR